MTRTDGVRGRHVRIGLAGLALAGVMLGTAATGTADPSSEPTPAPTGTAVPTGAAGATSAPKPTFAVEGGAAAGASTAATPTAAGDVLDQLAEEYVVGAGGGQVSNLLKTTLKLRAMGFRPSKANLQEITAAMGYRPNQMPLIGALKDTIAYQQKLKAQMEILQQYQQQQANGAVMGAGQMPADSNPAGLPGAGPAMPGVAAVAPGAAAPMPPAAEIPVTP